MVTLGNKEQYDEQQRLLQLPASFQHYESVAQGLAGHQAGNVHIRIKAPLLPTFAKTQFKDAALQTAFDQVSWAAWCLTGWVGLNGIWPGESTHLNFPMLSLTLPACKPQPPPAQPSALTSGRLPKGREGMAISFGWFCWARTCAAPPEDPMLSSYPICRILCSAEAISALRCVQQMDGVHYSLRGATTAHAHGCAPRSKVKS